MHEKKLRFAMKIGGDYRVHPWRNPWPKVAIELGLALETVLARVRDLTTRVGDAFAEAASAPEVVALGRPLPPRLVDLVSERAGRCAALLDAPAGA